MEFIIENQGFLQQIIPDQLQGNKRDFYLFHICLSIVDVFFLGSEQS